MSQFGQGMGQQYGQYGQGMGQQYGQGMGQYGQGMGQQYGQGMGQYGQSGSYFNQNPGYNSGSYYNRPGSSGGSYGGSYGNYGWNGSEKQNINILTILLSSLITLSICFITM